jgi:hypothetical protein
MNSERSSESFRCVGLRVQGWPTASRRALRIPLVGYVPRMKLTGLVERCRTGGVGRNSRSWYQSGSPKPVDQCATAGAIIPRSRRPKMKSWTATAVRRTPKTISETINDVGLIRLAILSMLLKIR